MIATNSQTNVQPIPLSHVKRILVIRRNRMGDMICTVPLLRALRHSLPGAHIKVACDSGGYSIAQSCGAADEVYLLKAGLNRWHTRSRNQRALRGFDLVIAVKGGFDRLLASMAKASRARWRVGFEQSDRSKKPRFYSHALPLPSPGREHQIETCLRLLQPLQVAGDPLDFRLAPSVEAERFAEAVAAEHGFANYPWTCLINLSCNRGLSWPLANYVRLLQLLKEHGGLIGLSCVPRDESVAAGLRRDAGNSQIFLLRSPGSMHLGAVLQRIRFLVTPEGGAAHLAAAMGAPALVMWPAADIQPKWQSRAANHHHLHVPGPEAITPEQLGNLLREKFEL